MSPCTQHTGLSSCGQPLSSPLCVIFLTGTLPGKGSWDIFSLPLQQPVDSPGVTGHLAAAPEGMGLRCHLRFSVFCVCINFVSFRRLQRSGYQSPEHLSIWRLRKADAGCPPHPPQEILGDHWWRVGAGNLAWRTALIVSHSHAIQCRQPLNGFCVTHRIRQS